MNILTGYEYLILGLLCIKVRQSDVLPISNKASKLFYMGTDIWFVLVLQGIPLPIVFLFFNIFIF